VGISEMRAARQY